ncbi:MAG: alanine racemase 1 [Candidatus Paraimprobicoccus trichonymphae]|uniref:Alanine racemase n=1 Tax=Candidatus Paraimprobicoccus trichonymphae TaxID=3033793 RepID=A0AA48L1D1_9FIRM|nr:MAG: alanine racemase 1 [Candidatus Paraimprobicoccus trichonymphae]
MIFIKTVRQTELIVDTQKIKYNILEIRKFAGSSVNIMPVVKARGYGTGIGTLPGFFKSVGINMLAVAAVDEGIGLRSRGFEDKIVVLNQITKDEIETAIDYDLTVGVSSLFENLNLEAQKKKTTIDIHLEIDTGMTRTGLDLKDVEKNLKNIKKFKNINLEGIYTHLSSSDSDSEYTLFQIKNFNKAIDITKNYFNLKYIHACNTAGFLNFKNAIYNTIRPGIAIYGHFPSEILKNKINLKPSTILKSKVVFIRKIRPGVSISYNRSYISSKNMIIATIPIGYADGIFRNYTGKLILNNKFANIVGVINMDSLMIDITNIPNVELGTEVYIWDNINITVEDIAKNCGTINYEILSKLEPRVCKVFI